MRDVYLVKVRVIRNVVIPAKAGIQRVDLIANGKELDSRFRGNDSSVQQNN